MKIGKYILLSALVFLCACEKVVFSTDYVVTPLLQSAKDAPVVEALSVKAFAYYGDTTYWKVESWEDALDGRITSKEDGSVRTPDFSAVPDAGGKLLLGPLTQTDFMVLVCFTDPSQVAGGKMYAWRNSKTAENLPTINVSVVFKPWQTLRSYADASWRMYNDNPPPEPEQ